MGRGWKGVALAGLLTLAAWAGPAMAETPAGEQAEPVLRFAPRVEVTSEERVTLLDLLEPGQEPPREAKEQMGVLTVTVAPGLGRHIAVSASKVKALMRQVDLGLAANAQVPETMLVERSAQRLTTDAMTQIYVEGVRERLGARASQSDIHHVEAGRDLLLPVGKIDTNLRLLRSNLMGRVPATLEVWVDGRRRAEVRMSGTVDIFAEVVVAARPLMQRHVVGPEDVELARVNLNEAGAGAVFDLVHVLGMRTRSAVPLGAPLDVTRLDRAPMIHPGDMVMMIYDLGGVRVTAKGRAEQTGFMHGRIRLTNLASKREVWGKVVASGSVVVE